MTQYKYFRRRNLLLKYLIMPKQKRKYCLPTAPPGASHSKLFSCLQDTVSVHRPGFYADRFQQFMCSTVFKKIPRMSSPHNTSRTPGSLLRSLIVFACSSFPVKPSPSKKSRGGGQVGLRRAPTLGAPTPLSHAMGQPGSDSKLVYHSHFKSTESEAEGGKTPALLGSFCRKPFLPSSLRATFLFSRRAVRQAGSGSADSPAS